MATIITKCPADAHGNRPDLCLEVSPKGMYKCTRPMGHTGKHHAHGKDIYDERCLAVW